MTAALRAVDADVVGLQEVWSLLSAVVDTPAGSLRVVVAHLAWP